MTASSIGSALRAVGTRPRTHLLSRHILALALLTVLAVWALAVVLTQRVADTERRESEQVMSNLTWAFAQTVGTSVQKLDFVTKDLREHWQHMPHTFDTALRDMQSQLSAELIFQVSVLDAHGRLIFNSRNPAAVGMDFSDREHFQAHRDTTADLLYISRPVLGRVSKRWSLQFTRALRDERQQLVGVIVLSVPADYFTRFHPTIHFRESAVSTLIDSQGFVLARQPNRTDPSARRLTLPESAQIDRSGNARASFVSSVDGVARAYAWRRVDGTGMTAALGVPLAALTPSLAQQRRMLFGVAALVTLLVAMMAAWAVRINRRRRADAAKLHEQALFFQAVTDALPVWVTYWKPGGECAFANAAARQGLALAPDLGVRLAEDGLPSSPTLRAITARLPSVGVDAPARFEVSTTSVAVADQLVELVADVRDGKVQGILAVATDIRVLKAAQLALIQANDALSQRTREAELANAYKSQFLADMSHEIRTPINSILGVSELALIQCPDTPSKSALQAVSSAARTLTCLVNDVLDLSRIEAGKFELTSAPFELQALLDDALGTVAPMAVAKGLTLECQVAADTPIHLWGDAGRIRQILVNLLSNAVKFTTDGRVWVKARAQPLSDTLIELVLTVSDTGAGIPVALQQHIFDPFVQGPANHAVTQFEVGTGLGLDICRRLAQIMGGQIQLLSSSGQGTTFACLLPLQRAEAAASGTIKAVPGLGGTGRRLHVLLAEDHPDNQAYATELLRFLGHDVVAVSDGEQACKHLCVNDALIDVVLMDVMMPLCDGNAATRRIRAWEAKLGRAPVPIVACTASVFAEERQLCLAAGANYVLEKPFTPQSLVACLQALVTPHQPIQPDTPGTPAA